MHRSIGDFALVALALVGGAVLARAASGSGRLRVVGGLTALIAAWLFTQRSDIASELILAAFFGAGVGLLIGPRRESAQGPRLARPRVVGTVLLIAVIGFALYVGAETPDSHWFGGGITHGWTRSNAVALTFDDGPNVSATLRIMKILDDAGVKGTFFEVGKAIDAEPQITRALYEHGQLLGNHSYNHGQWRWLDRRRWTGTGSRRP